VVLIENCGSIKRMAPRMLRTLWRAVTAEDYKTLAEALPELRKQRFFAHRRAVAYWDR